MSFVAWAFSCVTNGPKSALPSGAFRLPVIFPPFFVKPVVKSAWDSVPNP